MMSRMVICEIFSNEKEWALRRNPGLNPEPQRLDPDGAFVGIPLLLLLNGFP